MQKLIDLMNSYSWLYTVPWKWTADKKSIVISVGGAHYIVSEYREAPPVKGT
jgi:hypothetical protein